MKKDPAQEYLEKRLSQSLKKLEKSANGIVETRGYCEDAKHVRMLIELVKEQIKSENSSSPAN